MVASSRRRVSAEACLFNSYGRRISCLERKTPEALESIVAFKPQSTNQVDKVSRVIYQCHEDELLPVGQGREKEKGSSEIGIDHSPLSCKMSSQGVVSQIGHS